MASIPSGINDVLNDYLDKIGKQFNIKKVVLFGSLAKGLSNEESDIDLAVFSDDFVGMEPIERFRALFLLASDYNVDLQPLAFTLNELHEPDGLVAEILRTGIEVAATVKCRET